MWPALDSPLNTFPSCQICTVIYPYPPYSFIHTKWFHSSCQSLLRTAPNLEHSPNPQNIPIFSIGAQSVVANVTCQQLCQARRPMLCCSSLCFTPLNQRIIKILHFYAQHALLGRYTHFIKCPSHYFFTLFTLFLACKVTWCQPHSNDMTPAGRENFPCDFLNSQQLYSPKERELQHGTPFILVLKCAIFIPQILYKIQAMNVWIIRGYSRHFAPESASSCFHCFSADDSWIN